MADQYELPTVEPPTTPSKQKISTDVRRVSKDSTENSATSSSVHFSPISYQSDSTFVSPGLLRQNSVRERPALQGYPKLARFIGERPGYAIFRRFSDLNARNLLYMQAELLDLEEDLWESEVDDARDQDLKALQFSMRRIRSGKFEEGDSKIRQRWELYRDMRSLLKEYNEMLIQHHKLYSLPRPTHAEVRGLREFVCDSEIHGHGNEQEWLHHPENTIWSLNVDEKAAYETEAQRARAHERAKATQTDLVSLSGHVAPDSFTNLIRNKVVKRFHALFGRRFVQEDAEFGGHMYNGEILENLAFYISILFASLLPTGSIIALYYIPTLIWRLIFIGLWSATFSISLAFFTSATRIEIFTASVALASVQVVFVGTNGVTVIPAT